MTLYRFNRMAVLIAVCCWCCSAPSARLKTAAAAKPLGFRSSTTNHDHEDPFIVAEASEQQPPPPPPPSSSSISSSATPNYNVEETSRSTPIAAEPMADSRQRRDVSDQQQGLESLQLSENVPIKIVCEPPSSETLLRILGPAFNARYMAIDEPPEDASSTMTTLSPSSASRQGGSDDDEEGAVGIEADDSYMAGQQARYIEQRDLKPLDFAVDPSHEQAIPEDGLFNVQVNMMTPSNSTHREKRDTQELWKSLRRNHYEKFTPKRPNKGGSSAVSSSSSGSAFGGSSGAQPTPPWHCPSKVVWQNLGPAYFPQFVRSIQCGREGSVGATSCWFGAYECAPSSFTMKFLHRRSDYCYPVMEGNKTVRFEQKWTFVERAVPFCCSCQFKLFSGGNNKAVVNNGGGTGRLRTIG